MTTSAPNPFQKSSEKPSQLTVTLSGEQRQVVEQLREHLQLKTNTGVVMEGLAALYDKHRRQLAKDTPAAAPESA